VTAVCLLVALPVALGWVAAAVVVAVGVELLDECDCRAIVADAMTRHLHQAGMPGRWDPDPLDHRDEAVIALAAAVIRTGIPVPQRAKFLALHPRTWTQEPAS
jgi:hypothetical protein